MNKKVKRLTLAKLLVRGSLFPTVLPSLLIFLTTCVICFRFAITHSISYGQEKSDMTTSLIEERIRNVERLATNLPSLNASTSVNSRDSLYMLIRQSNPPGELTFLLPYYEHYTRIFQQLKSTYLVNDPYINGVYIITSKQRMFSFSQIASLLPDSEYPMEEYLQYSSGGFALMIGGMTRQYSSQSVAQRINTDSLLTLVSPVQGTGTPIAVALIDMNSQLMNISAAPQQGSVFLLL